MPTATSGAALGIAGLTLLVAPSPVFAAEFLVGAVAALGLLRLLAEALRRAIGNMPRPRSPLVRLAFAVAIHVENRSGGIVVCVRYPPDANRGCDAHGRLAQIARPRQ